MNKEKTDNKSEDNTIFVGTKPAMSYVLALITQFKDLKEIIIKARGKAISKAVDVAEITRNRFFTDAEIKDIIISTEKVTNEEGKDFNVSAIEIILKRK